MITQATNTSEFSDEEDDLHKSEYFVHLPTEDIGNAMVTMAENFMEYLETSGRLELWKKKWRWYYGHFQENNWRGGNDGLIRMGGNGEYLFFGSNQFRALGKQIYSLATQNDIAWEIESTNTDSTSNKMAITGKIILDYYMAHKQMKAKFEKMCEHSLIFDAGYLLVEWNQNVNSSKNVDPVWDVEGGATRPDGDLRVTNPTAFDVIYDPLKENWEDQNWFIIREWVNRDDLVARYPEYEEKIYAHQTKETMLESDRHTRHFNSTQTTGGLNDDVLTYRFMHHRTNSMPEGRLVFSMDGGEVLSDGDLPYDNLTLVRMVPDEEHGSCFGYSPLNVILPHQDYLNVSNSSIATNHHTTAIQLIAHEEGSDLQPSDLGNGIVILKYKKGGVPPQGISLTKTAPEIFKYREDIIREMEQLSGVSDISRGQQTREISGSGMALLASMTAQNQGSFQRAYAEACGIAATYMLQILSKFADNPRTIAIMGKHNDGRSVFTGTKDLVDFEHVRVNLGNPLTRTYAGKMQIADMLMNKGAINMDQFFEFLGSGNMESLQEGPRDEMNYIKLENEKLLEGVEFAAHPTDNDELHIAYHRRLFQRTSIRFPTNDEEMRIAEIAQDHMLQHEQQLANKQTGGVPAPASSPDEVIEQQAREKQIAAGGRNDTDGNDKELRADDAGVVTPTLNEIARAKEAGTDVPLMPQIAGSTTRFAG